MKQHTYLGIIGICSFVLSAIQFIFICNFPMIGYLIFQGARGSYTPGSYKTNTPLDAYLLGFVLLTISIGIAAYICKEQKSLKS